MNKLTIATALALVLSAPLALAQPPAAATAGAPQARVTYNVLALGKPATDAALQADLRRAARQVCGDFQRTTLSSREHYDTCYAQAMDSARRQIDAAHGYASATRTPQSGG